MYQVVYITFLGHESIVAKNLTAGEAVSLANNLNQYAVFCKYEARYQGQYARTLSLYCGKVQSYNIATIRKTLILRSVQFGKNGGKRHKNTPKSPQFNPYYTTLRKTLFLRIVRQTTIPHNKKAVSPHILTAHIFSLSFRLFRLALLPQFRSATPFPTRSNLPRNHRIKHLFRFQVLIVLSHLILWYHR